MIEVTNKMYQTLGHHRFMSQYRKGRPPTTMVLKLIEFISNDQHTILADDYSVITQFLGPFLFTHRYLILVLVFVKEKEKKGERLNGKQSVQETGISEVFIALDTRANLKKAVENFLYAINF